MKVILLAHVPRLGAKGDIKDVSPGYAQNHLIPRSLARLATAQSLHAKSRIEKQDLKMQKKRATQNASLARMLRDMTVSISAQASDQGTLYAAVSPADIVSGVLKQRVTIAPEQIEMRPIKSVGKYSVHITLGTQRIPITIIITQS